MENLQHPESSQDLSPWVKACADLLAPPADWEPNLSLARAAFEARADDHHRRRTGLKRYLLAGALAALIAWRELLLRALEAVKMGYQASGMDTHYEILVARIVRPILEGSEPVPFRELANKHGLTEKEAANRLLTARRAFQRLLRAEISLYASSEEEVTSEIKDIFRFLSGS